MITALIAIITMFILLTAFVFLMQNRIHNMVNTFVWQSSLLAAAAFLTALNTNEVALYVSAALTLGLKAITIPYLLRRLILKLNIRHKVSSIKHPFLLLVGAAALVLFCYQLVPTNNIIAIAMAVTLLGMVLLITHHKAISHAIGFMSMENGIFLAALLGAKGMPLIVELGIAFDVLVAIILFGMFFFQLRSNIDSLDVDRLNLLHENHE